MTSQNSVGNERLSKEDVCDILDEYWQDDGHDPEPPKEPKAQQDLHLSDFARIIIQYPSRMLSIRVTMPNMVHHGRITSPLEQSYDQHVNLIHMQDEMIEVNGEPRKWNREYLINVSGIFVRVTTQAS
jgi:hypothetical protein